MTPEQRARAKIDSLLEAAGWHVRDLGADNIHAARGVVTREFQSTKGHGFAGYLERRITKSALDKTARGCIPTNQRINSMLEDRDRPEEANEESIQRTQCLFEKLGRIEYNPVFPIESFDIIVTDEAHRSIYNLWRLMLEYFDAYVIGLTATPNKQTFSFFNRTLGWSTATRGWWPTS